MHSLPIQEGEKELVSEFVLRDESSNEEVLEVENLEPLALGDEKDEDLQKRSDEVEIGKKIKTKLNGDAFRATQSMFPPILALRIAQIDVGPLTRKPKDLPKGPLVPHSSAFIITESGQQIIFGMSETAQDKGK
ncbi:unnamed protein product [Lactuca saligna]|uniref:Uncharacterized protein n=1 Tax=Lactuca saligna TaxID=75948 RepID=A0AA35VF01_LACSI|nr:unnamed protein product [Lactuca saligna]